MKINDQMILDSNILNNKRSVPSFSVQILSIFTLSRRNKASFSHNPTILGCKNHIFPNIIFVGQKKKTKISVLLRGKKSMFWHFSETRIKRQTDIKKHITSANERNKAHFKRVQSHCYNRPLKFGDKGSLVYFYSIYTLD